MNTDGGSLFGGGVFLVFAFSDWPVLRRGPQSSAPPWQSPGY